MFQMRLWVLLALVASGCCCALGGELSEEERQRLEAERSAEREARAAAIENAPARAGRVPGIASSLTPGRPTLQRCPDSVLEERLGSSVLRHTIPAASLRGLSASEEPGWAWQSSSELESWRRIRDGESNLAESLLERAGGASTSLTVVFVHTERALPRVAREDGLFRAGSFETGYWVGGLHVVDVDAGRVLCSAPFEAESSEEIRGDDDFAEAIQDDFRERFEFAANAALSRVTDQLSVNVHGIL